MEEKKLQNAFLSIQNLEKVYPNGEKAVYNFNLDIHKNEFIVIVGPSGCGKSTTLRMIAGLEDISSGDIYMENELLNFKACKDRKMAIVFQSYALYPQMSVYDNIAFPLTINKYPFPVVNTKLRAAAELKKMLDSIPVDAILEALYNCNHDKAQKKNATENLAVCLNVSFETAEWLNNMYVPVKKQKLSNLIAMGDKIKQDFLREIEAGREAEMHIVTEKGIVLNESYCELKEDGSQKMVDRKMTAYEIRTKVYETAEVLDLTPYLDKLPKELSGGQMQRVALGRAIVKNVPVFLMDEPLSNLDAKLRQTMRTEIVKLHNRINATTIYVTHDQTEAMTMATSIVVMSRGFVQQIGAPEEIYHNPANIFVAKFIGSPSMNILELEYDKEKGCLLNKEGALLPIQADFAQRYENYYKEKIRLFSDMLENFDEKDAECVRKILSTLDGQKSVIKNNKDKAIHSKHKNENKGEDFTYEKDIATEILQALKEYQNGGRKLLAGIRPERIKIEKYCPDKQQDDGIRLKPTACELLGGEYNVYFDYCGNSMVAKVKEEERLSTRDEIVITFPADDIYIFDPVTGDVI